eukprot:TRINITY_DN5322_c0_g1_i1.p1 TRINITY_DN5322_c0_g1~~TRINITY_DN5322_c0_g1_i1.p1  ORF type:complete len:301 (+),score=37.61 TRINITY_DN5322_c0_g1_i1:99-1001(+)
MPWLHSWISFWLQRPVKVSHVDRRAKKKKKKKKKKKGKLKKKKKLKPRHFVCALGPSGGVGMDYYPCISVLSGLGWGGGGREKMLKATRFALKNCAIPVNPLNPKVWMDVQVGGKYAGRVFMELFMDTVPKTAENMRCLFTGEKGKGMSGRKLHLKGTAFHRIIPTFVVQGGDTTRGDGRGGESIFGARFEDESFKGKAGKHFGPGCLSMANAGPNTNGSQFFICVGPTPHLNGRHVVFGQIVHGYDVVLLMERMGTPSGRTRLEVKIHDCGQALEEDEWHETTEKYSPQIYGGFPNSPI